MREGAKLLNKNHWFPAATIIIGWPDETPDDVQHTIDMMGDFRAFDFRGLVAPLLYQDFSEKNSMHFGNLNEAQFTLFWKCWENIFVLLMISYQSFLETRHMDPQ